MSHFPCASQDHQKEDIRRSLWSNEIRLYWNNKFTICEHFSKIIVRNILHDRIIKIPRSAAWTFLSTAHLTGEAKRPSQGPGGQTKSSLCMRMNSHHQSVKVKTTRLPAGVQPIPMKHPFHIHINSLRLQEGSHKISLGKHN